MQSRYDRAELLVALWKLGADNEMMPTSHGILDRALNALRSALPQELGTLNFSTTGVGLRCHELPDILLAAQQAELTSEPNPTYLSTIVNLRSDRAIELAIMHGLNPSEAISLGRDLKQQVDQLKSDMGEMAAVAA